jgi:hypothetical protein
MEHDKRALLFVKSVDLEVVLEESNIVGAVMEEDVRIYLLKKKFVWIGSKVLLRRGVKKALPSDA